MKKKYLWIVGALTITGCTDPELTRESFDKLKAQNAELTTTVSEQDKFLADYSNSMVAILEQVSSIENNELRIRELSSSLSSAPYQEKDWVSEIGAEIERIEATLIANELRAEEMSHELNSQRELNDERVALLNSQKTIIAQQNKKLSRLQGQLQQLKGDFLVLQEENTRLGIRVEVGETRIAALDQEVSELTVKLKVFVLAGNVEDMRKFRKNDIVKSRLGRLEPDPASISDGRFKSVFQPFDLTQTTLTVPGNMTELRLRSIHGKHPDLFTVTDVEHGMQLLIKNPDTFWGLSRFLIIEAR